MLLSIHTSQREKLTVEVKEHGVVRHKLEVASIVGHAQHLLPAIQTILARGSVSPRDLTEVTVYPGPGSFTGLRVGASVGQALSYALSIPVNGKLSQEASVEVIYQ